ncbi:hypothetical protein [Streptomyces sp. NPDC090057]
MRLYTALGFARVGRNGASDTMVLNVRSCPAPPASRFDEVGE